MQSNCIYAMEIKNKKQTSGKGRETLTGEWKWPKNIIYFNKTHQFAQQTYVKMNFKYN